MAESVTEAAKGLQAFYKTRSVERMGTRNVRWNVLLKKRANIEYMVGKFPGIYRTLFTKEHFSQKTHTTQDLSIWAARKCT